MTLSAFAAAQISRASSRSVDDDVHRTRRNPESSRKLPAEFQALDDAPRHGTPSSQSSDPAVNLCKDGPIPHVQRDPAARPPPGAVMPSSQSGSITVELFDGQAVTLLGQYDLWVRRGAVSVMGAVLRASSATYRVYAPASHALPVICQFHDLLNTPDKTAELCITSCWSGLLPLSRSSPHFGDIWQARSRSRQTFTIVAFELAGKPRPAHLPLLNQANDCSWFPLSDSAQWHAVAASLPVHRGTNPLAVLVCGSKGVGKSTFSRYLANWLLTRKQLPHGMALLDLDPGHPEVGCPGQLTLSRIKSPLFGPPFTHPCFAECSKNVIVRSGYFGYSSPRDDTESYVEHSLELVRQYRTSLSPLGCPLVINTSGWFQGRGLEVLDILMRHCGLTDVVHLQGTGDLDADQELKSKADEVAAFFHSLSFNPLQFPIKAASDLRLMQAISYLHIDDHELGQPRWSAAPLHLRQPLELAFRGPQKDVEAVVILGNSIGQRCSIAAIDGCIVGLVAITYHLSSLQSDHVDSVSFATAIHDPKALASQEISRGQTGPPIGSQEYTPSQHHWGTARSISGLSTSQRPPQPLATRQAEITLDPRHCQLLAQVLVRGVDAERGTVQLVVPTYRNILACLETRNSRLVLVKGKTDLPTWVYLEPHRDNLFARNKEARRDRPEIREAARADAASSVGDFDNRLWQDGHVAKCPYVHQIVAGQRQQKGAKAWRVRRNLDHSTVLKDTPSTT